MHYIDRHVSAYVNKVMDGVAPVLHRIRHDGIEHNIPIIGNDVAGFLKTQIALKKPRAILEIGTAIGYSGALMLTNCQATLDTIEINYSNYRMAQENFKLLALDHRIKQHLGDASKILQLLIQAGQTFDFIFIDAAKAQYLDYFTKCDQLIAKNGVILADNVLYQGIVADLPYSRRNRTIYKRMRNFITSVIGYKDYDCALLTVGDGMLVAVKKI